MLYKNNYKYHHTYLWFYRIWFQVLLVGCNLILPWFYFDFTMVLLDFTWFYLILYWFYSVFTLILLDFALILLWFYLILLDFIRIFQLTFLQMNPSQFDPWGTGIGIDRELTWTFRNYLKFVTAFQMRISSTI